MKNETKANKPDSSVPFGDSLISKNRLKYLAWKCRETLKRTPGNVLEVGIYKGGSLLALAKVVKEICPQYKVYGIDTFSGHPYTDNHPMHPSGRYADVSKEDIEEYIRSKRLEKWVTIYQGKVEKVLEGLNLKDISFAHIDCDLYIPVKYCAENVPKIMKKHGVIYFDDYRHEHCPGATKAVDESFKIHEIQLVKMQGEDVSWAGYVQL